LSTGLTALVVYVLKQIVGRARPCACMPGVHSVIVDPPTDPSFPSGHAAGIFTVAAFAWIVLRARKRDAWIGYVLFAIAFAVALSRVYLGVHFPSDVLVGA